MRGLALGIALLAAVIAPTGPSVARARPVAVTVGPRVADPSGGPVWAVRSWRAQAAPGARRCLQIGRLVGGRLARLFAGSRVRVLRLSDRAVCVGGYGYPQDSVLVERLVDDPHAAAPRLVRTLVAGVLAAGVKQVIVSAGAAELPVTTDPRRRVFLAVLPGDVRRADLALSFRFARSRRVLDFRVGPSDQPLVPGSTRTSIVIHDPRAPAPLALVVFRVSGSTVHGRDTQPCAEPAELVGGEPGSYNAAWGDFLDAPTLIGAPEFTDTWEPTGVPATNIDSCLTGVGDFTYGPVGGLGAKRIASDLVVIHGFLAPGVRRLTVVSPSGASFEATIDPSTRSFLAPVTSFGARGEQARLIATGGSPRKRTAEVALGDQETPRSFTYELRDRRRTLRVAWDGGFEPFIGADVLGPPRRLVVRVLELFPPDFAPDGVSYAIPAIGIYKCADIHLSRPVPSRAEIIDAATGHRAALAAHLQPPRGQRCTGVRPGQRLNPRGSRTLGAESRRVMP